TCLFLFTGCASIDFKNKHDVTAYNLAKQISNSNKDIETAKGLGWLKIKEVRNETNLEIIYKIAWATKPPQKIRITLLSGGFPVETIVSNGEKISLFSHTGEHSLKTYNINNPSLEDIISIPVRIEDIILLLSGQIPIKDFSYAFFDNNEVDLKAIVLKNKSDNGIQKIFIDHKGQIKKYLVTNRRIEPIYSVTFFNFIPIASATIPSNILIKDNFNREVSFEISKFYKNIPVKKSMFTLTEKR
ncbi:MAG: hypothetical protein GY707_03800, partial [Desulfobacteraceae bacterium]|nr:hypothetical protein [Desulfobacteraceae bacterium]